MLWRKFHFNFPFTRKKIPCLVLLWMTTKCWAMQYNNLNISFIVDRFCPILSFLVSVENGQLKTLKKLWKNCWRLLCKLPGHRRILEGKDALSACWVELSEGVEAEGSEEVGWVVVKWSELGLPLHPLIPFLRFQLWASLLPFRETVPEHSV